MCRNTTCSLLALKPISKMKRFISYAVLAIIASIIASGSGPDPGSQ